ncbi:MAG TPA: hypothetical protein VGD40_09745 [Chryseosolibacter sp.]
MATPYFEEVQRMRDNRWLITFIFAVAILSTLPLVYALYWQIGQDVPFGEEPMKNGQLIVMTLFVFTAVAGMMFILFALKLEVRIDEQGIHYRMFPVKWEWRVVGPTEIVHYEFADRYRLFESGGIGHHRNIFKNTRSFRIWGGKHMTIKFRDGHRLLLGTRDPIGMEWAMRKLMKKI